VIVKSGRTRRLDEPPTGRAAKNVHLVRRAEPNGTGACGAVADFGEANIPAASYDRYHDEGRKVAEGGVLHAFHFRYAARKAACHTTDDSSQDSIVPWDPRSNRSRTYASSEGLADQRIELKQYRVDASSPTCVRFRLSGLGRGSFLRINDLEGLVANGLSYVRANENQWSLSP
jgi:hypothetical protein